MKNSLTLRLPFNGSWFVFWGGDKLELNNHIGDKAQKGAFDFVLHDKQGKSHKGSGAKNEDYHAFGEDVLSPADGVVIEAVQGVRDNKPGEINRFAVGGNYLLIEHRPTELSFLAHLKQGSATVKQGDRVKTGEKLGECGNSGNSSEPHIHYHLQNSEVHSIVGSSSAEPVARGIKVYFSDVYVRREGKASLSNKYSPIRGDTVGFSPLR